MVRSNLGKVGSNRRHKHFWHQAAATGKPPRMSRRHRAGVPGGISSLSRISGGRIPHRPVARLRDRLIAVKGRRT